MCLIGKFGCKLWEVMEVTRLFLKNKNLQQLLFYIIYFGYICLARFNMSEFRDNVYVSCENLGWYNLAIDIILYSIILLIIILELLKNVFMYILSRNSNSCNDVGACDCN